MTGANEMTTQDAGAPSELQQLAQRHMWMHFTPMSSFRGEEARIIVRGDGCHVFDERGKRYFDGLSGLFCVNLGHGRAELGEAAARQAQELGFYPNWSFAHPPAVRLAARLAEGAPGDLNRVFFTSGGSESVESAWKMARQYHKLRGDSTRTKLIAREVAYHGASLGALAATGITGIRSTFEPLTPGGVHVPNTNRYRCELCGGEPACSLACADAIEQKIEFEGPETVAAVIVEPVQTAGGCFLPAPGYFEKVREICDRHGVLLISDEVICAFGRIGYMFGCERFGYQPDLVTIAKGLTNAYAPLGAVVASDRVFEAFEDTAFLHGFTFAGHPLSTAVANAALDIYEREDIFAHVRANEPVFDKALQELRDIPIVGDVRGAGYFYAIELVKDQETKQTFSEEEQQRLLADFASPELFRRGLICRMDSRGDPVVSLSPPLICGPSEFEYMAGTLREVLTDVVRML
ncbi:MAG TPA: aspartate aminotransferase family protein [Conexibacter sp.]|nr:aspartate aminotransferase family protein [Conexibacter sp.]